MNKLLARFAVLSAIGGFVLLSPPCFARTAELAQLDLEELMNIPVYAASKYQQNQTNAPAAVSVVTAEQIKTYGWRHLGDILQAQRGMYLSYDRIYGYLGMRGVLTFGDLNSRILITLDGQRISDVVYNQAFILNDFILDTHLIERIEIIRGPNSTLHGATPILGVINIVSRVAKENEPNNEVKLGVGNGQWRDVAYSYSRKINQDTQLVLSASYLQTQGESLYFDEPTRFSGSVHHTDYEKNPRFFAKLNHKNTQLMLAYAKRKKGIPTGATGSVFNDAANYYIDEQWALNATHDWQLNENNVLTGIAYAGAYDFYGHLLYDDVASKTINIDQAFARWLGTEWKLVNTQGAHQRVLGLEYQNNLRQDQKAFELDGLGYVDDQRNSERYGVYFQDEWAFTPKASLVIGARYDRDYTKQDHFTPKFAWIYHSDENKTFKLMASRAYRTPNVAELYYNYPGYAQNSDLKSEFAYNLEAAFEHQLSPRTFYTINPYWMKIDDHIKQRTVANGDVQYQNYGEIQTRGVEFELRHQFDQQGQIQLGYTWLQSKNQNGDHLTDSPQHDVSLNYQRPLVGDKLQLGLGYIYTSPRLTFLNQKTDASSIVNMNFSGKLPVVGNADWSLGIYNLFDESYSTPDTPDAGVERDRIQQDGRAWRANLALKF